MELVLSIWLNTLRENTAAHRKANPYVVIDGYPSKVLIVLCVGEDGLLQYIYSAGRYNSALADTHSWYRGGNTV